MATVTLTEVDTSDVPHMVDKLRKGFRSGKTREKSYRIQQLKNLFRMLEEKEDQILEAGYNDLRKSKQEMTVTEMFSVKAEIRNAINHLDEWIKPEYVKKDIVNLINTLYIQREPLGVVCVVSTWNYPVVLLLQPLATAIAAGNAVLLKPSDVAINTSNLFMEIIPQYLDKDCCAVAAGGIPVAQAVLKERFDHIFFIGSSSIGKIIMKAAAEHLTPVTLELGGKNPCIVDKSANLRVAGRRIAWGKYTNCGQTCIAPDYILCHESLKDKLVDSIKKAVQEFYGDDPKESKDYGRIINQHHFERLKKLLKCEGSYAMGGETNKDDLYIAPTIITHVNTSDAIMTDEVFGPLLPIVVVDSLDDAINFINEREKPLAVYAFTSDSAEKEKITASTSSGGVVFNDIMVQFVALTLPFGGVGNSGHGAYHGKFGFDTFSHKKACYSTFPAITEPMMKIRYPPFTDTNVKIAKFLLVPKEKAGPNYMAMFLWTIIAVVILAIVLQLYM